MPQSNQADDPAMSVSALAIQPPVQLSAVTRRWCVPAGARRCAASASAVRLQCGIGHVVCSCVAS